jgi:hypothetical protein
MIINGEFSHSSLWPSPEIDATTCFREQTYDKDTGGIITVTSELGEPIHKVATRGVKLWKELDKYVSPLLFVEFPTNSSLFAIVESYSLCHVRNRLFG